MNPLAKFLRALCVLSAFAVNGTLFAQPSSTAFDQLLQQGIALHDSLPSASKKFYFQALAVSKGQPAKRMALLYNELGSLFQFQGNYDSSLIFYQKGKVLAVEINDPKEIAAAYTGIADDYRNLSVKDSSHYYLDKALAVVKENKLYADEAGIYSDLGNLYRDENELEKSLTSYIKAATLYDSLIKDQVGLSRALSNIANIHYLLRNYDKALDYVSKSNTIAVKESYFRGIAYNHKLAARTYRQMKDLPKAVTEYEEAMEIYKITNDKLSMGETALGIGNIRYDQKDYKGAMNDYKKALEIARSIGVKSLMAYCYSALGFGYDALEQWTPATLYMDSTLTAAREVNFPYLVLDAYEVLASIEEKQHNYEKSLSYVYKYIALKDSLTSVENRAAIEEAEAKYQNDRKTAEIELLQKDQQIQAATLQRNKVITAGVGVALIAAIVIAFLVLNRYRILNESKRQIEMERMRNQIARDLHDDIGSTLSSINIISQVALKENGHALSTTPHFQRIHDHSSQIMESMADIVWSIHPGNDSMEKVIAKMKEFCGEILEPKDITYKFKNEELLAGVTLDLESRKNLFLIFKEIINNAAKYSEATEVDILFTKEHIRWSMIISDNGRGFNRDNIKRGNGLANMTKRAESMKASLNIKSVPGSGTCIVMESQVMSIT